MRDVTVAKVGPELGRLDACTHAKLCLREREVSLAFGGDRQTEVVLDGNALLVHCNQVTADSGPVLGQLDELDVALDKLQRRGVVALGEEGDVEIYLSQGERSVYILGSQVRSFACIPAIDMADNLADPCRNATQHVYEEDLNNNFRILGAQYLPLQSVIDPYGDLRASEMGEGLAGNGLQRLLGAHLLVEVKSDGEGVERLVEFRNIASIVVDVVFIRSLATIITLVCQYLAGIADYCEYFLHLVRGKACQERCKEFHEL